MTRLYLVRHGTHDLVGKVLAGRMAGVSLSEAGQAQADRLARFFGGQDDVAEILSSPLERCRETAAPIAARLGLSVMVDDALTELDCGDWTGCSFGDLAGDARWREWNSARDRAVVPGGESAGDVLARIMPLVQRAAAEDRGACVMVTHGDVIKVAVLRLLGICPERHDRIEIDTASVTTLDLWPGGGKLVRSNQAVPS